ncbi:hypothetical protein JOB18_035797 [Solea senegalensis]|uniref:Small integral membrane protein 5 n=1 Tax=Solea senegalensis TaxID=28829 RepID=A0AAV6RPZ7_SOLSE|nr:small integral membrane protein 5-like [Solea senegalensis]KAG7507491.1 hypothetical protein JOB18_035797 [Solea senegalensis]
MDVKEEMMEILEKMLSKLLDLPRANVLDQRAFVVVVLFVAMFIFMIILPCVYCCYQEKTKQQASSSVQPLEPEPV